MINNSIYYLAELISNEGIPNIVLVKYEELGNFLDKLDTDAYTLNNLYGVGNVVLDYTKFLKPDNS